MASKFADTKDIECKMNRKEKIEGAVVALLEAIGENPQREGLKGTPDRIARMYEEIFRGYNLESKPRMAVFNNGRDGIVFDNMVTDTGPFYSMCEHHMMPFFGRYVFAYIPSAKGKIIGLSKIGRLIDWHCARLQIQERLVSDIVKDITEILSRDAEPPLGVALFMEGEHLCKTMRGVKKQGKMSCTYLTGAFRENAQARGEFFNTIKQL